MLRLYKTALLCGCVVLAGACAEDDWERAPKSLVSAAPNAVKLYQYLVNNYGKRIIAGQMDTAWSDSMDMVDRVFKDTGKYPALKGFDFINIQQPSWDGGGSKQTLEAIQWWENPPIQGKHGIVAFCWHWRPGGTQDFYTNNTSFRIPWKNGELNTESPNWQIILGDLELLCAELQRLKDAEVPVLWRPLHEASGGWFWWGASGAKPYIALWEFLHKYLDEKGFDNLIWVWNGQSETWFPKASTVDIVGTDIYPAAQDYSPQSNLFYKTRDMVPKRDCIVALTENGEIPDPDKLEAYEVKWSWFMTWNDAGAIATNKDNFWSGDYHNTSAHKRHVYQHKYVLTLDELDL